LDRCRDDLGQPVTITPDSHLSGRDRLPAEELVAIARTDEISKADLGIVLEKFAEQLRRDDESHAQSYARFITTRLGSPCSLPIRLAAMSPTGISNSLSERWQRPRQDGCVERRRSERRVGAHR
jgi:hypothetical protein